jgi:hypothetical protein
MTLPKLDEGKSLPAFVLPAIGIPCRALAGRRISTETFNGDVRRRPADRHVAALM